MANGYKVAVLAGGESSEREISLQSGQSAYSALQKAGCSATLIDPANKEEIQKLFTEPFDVAFLCLHGKEGEDGTIQGFLETIKLPYTGSGVYSSAVTMNKVLSKTVYKEHGIQTPASLSINKPAGEKTVGEGDVNTTTANNTTNTTNNANTTINITNNANTVKNNPNTPYTFTDVSEKLGVPFIVKPSNEGSAIGVHIVNTEKEYKDALTDVFSTDTQAVLETYIQGTELTAAVIGNTTLEALPLIQIVPRNEFYDFDAKYAPGGSKHICPAPISEDATQQIQAAAVQAHKALQCQGMSRSDFILDANGQAWILETNTIPGMTQTSLLPDAAKAAGISFPELCLKLIEFALRKA